MLYLFVYSNAYLTAAQILCDAECVFQHVRVQLKTNLRRLILFGESIGSVPSIHLATRYKVRGLILQGALASGIKVFFPFVDANPFGIDCFRNIERVSNVSGQITRTFSLYQNT